MTDNLLTLRDEIQSFESKMEDLKELDFYWRRRIDQIEVVTSLRTDVDHPKEQARKSSEQTIFQSSEKPLPL